MKTIYIPTVILFKLCLDNGAIFCRFLTIVLVDSWLHRPQSMSSIGHSKLHAFDAAVKQNNSQHSTHSFIPHKPTKKRRKKMTNCFLLKGCSQDWLNRLRMTKHNCRPYRSKPNTIGGLVKLCTFQVKLQALAIKCSLQWTTNSKYKFQDALNDLHTVALVSFLRGREAEGIKVCNHVPFSSGLCIDIREKTFL